MGILREKAELYHSPRSRHSPRPSWLPPALARAALPALDAHLPSVRIYSSSNTQLFPHCGGPSQPVFLTSCWHFLLPTPLGCIWCDGDNGEGRNQPPWGRQNEPVRQGYLPWRASCLGICVLGWGRLGERLLRNPRSSYLSHVLTWRGGEGRGYALLPLQEHWTVSRDILMFTTRANASAIWWVKALGSAKHSIEHRDSPLPPPHPNSLSCHHGQRIFWPKCG